MEIDQALYQPGKQKHWQGRVDGTARETLRWHQLIQPVDLQSPVDLNGAYVLLGFCCDAGVQRNQGRVGAKAGPAAFRSILAGLPVHFPEHTRMLDAGDVSCQDDDLEAAQASLAAAVSRIISQGGFPVLLGGGHEITYPHYCGLQKASQQRVGIINIDAHLDIRPLKDGRGNSGTGFFQIAADCESRQQPFDYLAIGIQKISNTKALFDYAAEKGVEIIEADALYMENMGRLIDQVIAFAKKVDIVYLTVDLDAFAAAYAPGVSALAFQGIQPDKAFQLLFDTIIRLPNLRSVDIAELNPHYDIDHRTTKLGADLLFRLLAN